MVHGRKRHAVCQHAVGLCLSYGSATWRSAVLTPKVVGACADDSIESLGGDSLQAMDIQAELERQFSVAIPKELVESRPSIRACRRGRAPMNKTSHYNTPYGVFSRTIFRVAARLRRDPMIKTSDLATRLLHAAFPRLAFARNLCAIFERIPPAERPHSAFKDDPTKDVQIVAKNSDVLAVQSRFRDARLDMLEAYSNAARPPRVCLVYGQNNWDDRIQAEHMAGLSSVTFCAIENCEEHNVIVEAIIRGDFDGLLDWLVRAAEERLLSPPHGHCADRRS